MARVIPQRSWTCRGRWTEKQIYQLDEGNTIEQVMEDVFKEKKDDRDEEEAEAKDEGGKKVEEEIKLNKTETNPKDKEEGNTKVE